MEQPWTTSNELCLAFANTLRWHASNMPLETLHGYADMLAWAHEQGLVTAEASALLAETVRQQPDEAAAVFGRGIALREAIYRVFVARIHNHESERANLAIINAELVVAHQHARVVAQEMDFAWVWIIDGNELDAPLWAVARSAASLLTATELLNRVGQCADDRGCGWLFLDLSKNHSRRWCDINDCGNRAKQRRFQARARKQALS